MEDPMPSTQNRLGGHKWKPAKVYKPVTYFDEFPRIIYPAGNKFVEENPGFKFWPNDNGIIYAPTIFDRKPKPKPVKNYKPRGPQYGRKNDGTPRVQNIASMESRANWRMMRARSDTC